MPGLGLGLGTQVLVNNTALCVSRILKVSDFLTKCNLRTVLCCRLEHNGRNASVRENGGK